MQSAALHTSEGSCRDRKSIIAKPTEQSRNVKPTGQSRIEAVLYFTARPTF